MCVKRIACTLNQLSHCSVERTQVDSVRGTDNDVILVAIGCPGHLVKDRTDLEDGNYNFHSLDPLVDYECRQKDRYKATS